MKQAKHQPTAARMNYTAPLNELPERNENWSPDMSNTGTPPKTPTQVNPTSNGSGHVIAATLLCAALTSTATHARDIKMLSETQADAKANSSHGYENLDNQIDANNAQPDIQTPDYLAPTESEVLAAKAGPANTPNQVLFDFDDFDIRPDAVLTLAAHADYLNANPDLVVRIDGHADSHGNTQYNKALAASRAEAVARALIQRGVDYDQVSVMSFGEQRAQNRRTTSSDRVLMRRVDIVYINASANTPLSSNTATELRHVDSKKPDHAS